MLAWHLLAFTALICVQQAIQKFLLDDSPSDKVSSPGSLPAEKSREETCKIPESPTIGKDSSKSPSKSPDDGLDDKGETREAAEVIDCSSCRSLPISKGSATGELIESTC